MRRLASIAGAALLALTAFATPASANNVMAGGSCGTSAGEYGLDDVNSADYGYNLHHVPSLYYQLTYSGVPAPTTVGVIVRYNGELQSQRAVASFTAEESGGTYTSALGGPAPGNYVFYAYTGSRGDIYNVKDGTVAHNAFIADEDGYLGMFSCGVSTDQGTGPG